MKRILILGILAMATVVHAADEPVYSNADEAFKAILQDSDAKEGDDIDEAKAMRLASIREAANVYGNQLAWKSRWQELEAKLHGRANELNRIFDFTLFYLRNGELQPPILDTATALSDISDEGRVRELVKRIYRVRTEAKFTHAPLTWRDFLLPGYMGANPVPQKELMPRDDLERDAWKKGIDAGWQEGVKNANAEMRERIAALHVAYQGMALYTALAMRGMIDPPVVEEVQTPVTDRNGKKELLIGVAKRVITKDAYFVTEPDRWKALAYLRDWGALPK